MINQESQACILIVDDDPEIRRNIEKMLDRAGFSILTATNSIEALQCLEDQHVDLALLDVMMPDWTGKFSKQAGVNLLKEIRARNQYIPIVMLTASKDISLAVESMKYGAFDYLEKGTVSGSEFVITVQNALDSKNNKENLLYPSNVFPDHKSRTSSKWKEWLLERSSGLLDEVIGAIVVGALLSLFGIVTGIFKTTTVYIVVYAIISIFFIFALLGIYIWWQNKNRK